MSVHFIGSSFRSKVLHTTISIAISRSLSLSLIDKALDSPTPHVALVASPNKGHIIPFLEFAKRLITVQSIHATVFIITIEASTAQSQFLQSLAVPQGLHIVELPPPDISGLISVDALFLNRFSVVVKQSIPTLRSSIKAMPSRPKALIVDIFCIDTFEIAVDLNITKLLFSTVSATCMASILYLPVLDRTVEGDYRELPEPVRIPGCKPIRQDDLPEPLFDRKDMQYPLFVKIASDCQMADGILVNTWQDLEPTSFRALRDDEILRRQIVIPPFYSVGPIVRSIVPSSSTARLECLEWLDMQPSESVLFVSFGSYGKLSADQLTELAWGLELSQQRFIWVVRSPPSSTKLGDDPSEYLPNGFSTRTQAVGMVVPQWAPQIDILAHQSTGGFLTHCGLNSTLESIVNGVPMIAWPLWTDQKMNASMLSEDLRVAVRIKVSHINGIVGREEIEKMVRLVMKGKEGCELRTRVKELKSCALKALGDGGSSYNSLSQLVKDWK